MSTFTYWQLTWGGLFDGTAADGIIHLVRKTPAGTPGPTLCGIDRFAPDGPGGSWTPEPRGIDGKPLNVCGLCVESQRLRPDGIEDESPKEAMERMRLMVAKEDELRISALSLHDQKVGLEAALVEMRGYIEANKIPRNTES